MTASDMTTARAITMVRTGHVASRRSCWCTRSGLI